MYHPLNSVLHVSGVEAAAVLMLFFSVIMTNLMIWDLSRPPYRVTVMEFRGQDTPPPFTSFVFSNGLQGTYMRKGLGGYQIHYLASDGNLIVEFMDPRSFWMSLRSINGRKVILPPYQD